MRTVADRASRPLLKKEVAERWIDRTLQVSVARRLGAAPVIYRTEGLVFAEAVRVDSADETA